MKVVFSNHARERCKRRSIDMSRLQRQLESLPPTSNLGHWHFGKMKVAFERKQNDVLLIISVMWRNK